MIDLGLNTKKLFANLNNLKSMAIYSKNSVLLLIFTTYACLIKAADTNPIVVCYDIGGMIMYTVLELDFHAVFIKTLSAPESNPSYTACYNGRKITTDQKYIYRYLKDLHIRQEARKPSELSHATIEAYFDGRKVAYKKAKPA